MWFKYLHPSDSTLQVCLHLCRKACFSNLKSYRLVSIQTQPVVRDLQLSYGDTVKEAMV